MTEPRPEDEARAATPPPLERGDRVAARYVLEAELGRGGLATAWRARDVILDEAVTLKLLFGADAERRAALEREFARLGGLEHDHLVRVRTFGFDRRLGATYYTADFVDGEPLDRWARERAWPALERAFTDALRALAFLHALGTRHGDFKPDNIVVDADGRASLIDLSAASPLRTEPAATVSGSPGFLAPELLAGEAADGRADLYAVGQTLRALLAHATADPPAAHAHLADRLCAERPSDRPASVDEVLEAFGVVADRGPARGAAPRLLGRDDERAAASAALDAYLRGEPGPRAFGIFGEPGAGRSRLLRELEWRFAPRVRTIEAHALSENPVGTALGLAATGVPARGLDGILEAHALLATAEPTVVLFDDAHLLEDADATLLCALLRALTPSDRLFVLVTATAPLGVTLDTSVTLGPLSLDAVREWADDTVSGDAVAHLHRATLGHPGRVRRLLAQLVAGELTEGDLVSLREMHHDDAVSVWAFEGLDAESRRALAWFATERALAARLVSDPPPDAFVSPSARFALQRLGLLARQPDGRLRLTVAPRAVLGDGTDGALDAGLVQDAHAAHAARARAAARDADPADPTRASECLGLAAEHLVASGDIKGALALLGDRAGHPALAPRAWVPACEALLHRHVPERGTDDLLAIARVFESAGMPKRALALIAAHWKARHHRAGTEADADARARAALRAHAASACLKAGQPVAALRHARRVLAADAGPDVLGRAAAAFAHASIQRGDYPGAARAADDAIARGVDATAHGQLLEARALADLYRGEHAAAAATLEEARAAADARPRTRVRLASYEALAAYLRGDLERAERDYEAALHIARQAGIDDQLASALVNLGTVRQRRAEWGGAQRSYERALRVATALGKRPTQTAIELNLANLFAAIGLFDRARVMLERARPHVKGRRAPGAAMIEADIALGAGAYDDARNLYAKTHDIADALGATREVLEALIQRAETGLAAGDLDDARAALGRFEARDDEGDLDDDLAIRLALARGGLALAERAFSHAIDTLESAEARAADHAEVELLALVRARLAKAYASAGAPALAERAARRARRAWERAALSLPPEAREAFFGHPARRGLRRDAPAEATLAAPRKLGRLLAINHRLTSSFEVADILETALDAAIELTSAERGFILLRRDRTAPSGATNGDAAAVEVAVARHVDREQLLGEGHAFSRRIAAQVLETGEPVLTHDAGEDERFAGNRSIHAMRLKSVLAAPIRTGGRTFGALYLDNRLRTGTFAPDDAELLLGFADQVAIALENARLVRELRDKTALLEAQAKGLEAHRQRIEALAEHQLETIAHLEAERRGRERAATGPVSFGDVLGGSPPMRALFALLDRVAASPLDLLIRGESGTGKERVARAIHDAGPRRDQPFVAINCAALPETLLESELFGHRRGAFTGADRDREGIFVAAEGGTLLLDEIGEMPLAMQAKLLRALQEREVRPVGARHAVPFDVRVISATHRDLSAEIAADRFREDLYYRLAVVEVVVPPLRDRRGDVALLAEAIVARLAEQHDAPPRRLAASALSALEAHRWPGNVRELENALSRAWLMGGDVLTGADIVVADAHAASAPPAQPSRARKEAARLREALEEMDWNVSAVSRALGIPRNTLYRKLDKYRLRRPPQPTQ